jgi:hypothetical protein
VEHPDVHDAGVVAYVRGVEPLPLIAFTHERTRFCAGMLQGEQASDAVPLGLPRSATHPPPADGVGRQDVAG